MRLDGCLVAELQAALPELWRDREELRGSLSCHPEQAERAPVIPSERSESRDPHLQGAARGQLLSSQVSPAASGQRSALAASNVRSGRFRGTALPDPRSVVRYAEKKKGPSA